LILGGACASYTERTASALGDFHGGQFDEALGAYAEEGFLDSEFLSGAEAGTVALTAGEWDLALLHLGRAAAAAESIESQALVDAERLGKGLAAWALTDSARDYRGEGFERVYVHCSLAMAYLAKGMVDDVYVETRLANGLLESEERLYETEYRAGGWGHLISAVAYELLGEPDQALIDYQRMISKGVGTALAGRALVRLARQLGRNDLLHDLEAEHGPDPEYPEGAASVVVLAGLGTGPYKVEAALVLPTPDGILKFVAPRYVRRPQPVEELRLVVDESIAVRTDMVEQVSDIASQSLQDRLGWMAARSLLRGVLKRELTKRLEDEYDLAGRIVGDLLALGTERADLRSWLTLPDSYQACRLFVSPGVHCLALEAVGGDRSTLGIYELDPGETVLIFARTLGTQVHAHVIGGRLAEGSKNMVMSRGAASP
jgi:hypothetical protein